MGLADGAAAAGGQEEAGKEAAAAPVATRMNDSMLYSLKHCVTQPTINLLYKQKHSWKSTRKT